MAKFYGSVKGAKGSVSRLGHRSMEVIAASWHGAIETTLIAQADGSVSWVVTMVPWRGVGERRELARGTMGVDAPRVDSVFVS